MANMPEHHYDKNDTDPEHQEQIIRERAYSMWEADGCPEGSADLYWNRAKEMIEAEHQSAYPPSQSRGNRA